MIISYYTFKLFVHTIHHLSLYCLLSTVYICCLVNFWLFYMNDMTTFWAYSYLSKSDLSF